MSDDFTRRLLTEICADDAADVLTRYLAKFEGRFFDTYGRDGEDPDRITDTDLIAVGFLSIEIRYTTTSGFTPQHAVALSERADDITRLLRKIGADRELHTLDEDEVTERLDGGPDSPGEQLWRLLRDEIGIPRVARYKLAARKRPHLLPIRDRVTEKALGAESQPLWWRPWWEAMQDERITSTLGSLRTGEPAAAHLSLLRVADIVIWMRHKKW